MKTLAAAFAGFALGAIPFSWLLGRMVGGLDIRRRGSGNVGATNLARALGMRIGIAGLLLDAAKGAGAVLLARLIAPGSETAPLWAGGMAVLGHNFSPILGFRGGKGVATGAGAFAVLAPWALLAACVVFAVTLAVSRMVSLGSMAAAVALPCASLATGAGTPLVVLAFLTAGLVVARHRANLARILDGTEHRVGSGGRT